ncbi:MAG: hypothetical protein PHC75_01785 [Burkholderiales bacterium]|nr:hypothetical protein [Burkholderiales bacterium]
MGHEDADFFIRLLHSGVRIKDGRFAIPVYHLWHKLSPRNNEKENLARMMERSRGKSCIKAKSQNIYDVSFIDIVNEVKNFSEDILIINMNMFDYYCVNTISSTKDKYEEN